jgi:alkanesulfonate monooxygenase
LSRYMSVGYQSFILDIPPTQEELQHTNQAFRRAVTLAGR